jgi:pilus retraction protein PilT
MNEPDNLEMLEGVCSAAVTNGASDILLHEGRVPRLRIGGRIVPLESPPLASGFFDALGSLSGCGECSDHDASLALAGARFRVNQLRCLGARAAVLRLIRSEIPDLESLGLPTATLRQWAAARQGLVLVCGPAGSGKSTTLAAMLGWMNSNHVRHVVTIEDPVEFEFRDGTCLFTQREVGVDTPSFAEGLRRCLRQNPDVILIGEIRDPVAAEAALQAAETGHLVLATLHSPDCADAIERLGSLFGPASRGAACRTLSNQLLGILCQNLLPGTGDTRRPATEFFNNTGATRLFIAEEKTSELSDFINASDGSDARGFTASLAALVRDGAVAEDVALAACARPQELRRLLRGISSSPASTRR